MAGYAGSIHTLAPFALVRLFFICLAATFITHPGLWLAIANGYPGDSLFTLSVSQRVGLILITCVLVLLLFFICTVSSYTLCKLIRKHVARWFIILSCTVTALLLCAIALLLVPQLHYLYYRLIIPGLPAQIVPAGDLSLSQLWQYFMLAADANTSVHASGATVWICVFASVLVAFKESKPFINRRGVL